MLVLSEAAILVRSNYLANQTIADIPAACQTLMAGLPGEQAPEPIQIPENLHAVFNREILDLLVGALDPQVESSIHTYYTPKFFYAVLNHLANLPENEAKEAFIHLLYSPQEWIWQRDTIETPRTPPLTKVSPPRSAHIYTNQRIPWRFVKLVLGQ